MIIFTLFQTCFAKLVMHLRVKPKTNKTKKTPMWTATQSKRSWLSTPPSPTRLFSHLESGSRSFWFRANEAKPSGCFNINIICDVSGENKQLCASRCLKHMCHHEGSPRTVAQLRRQRAANHNPVKHRVPIIRLFYVNEGTECKTWQHSLAEA